MLAALDRHLRLNDSKIFIARDREFVKCRQVLEGKARALREKATKKDQMQQKHLPFKMKSSYGKIVFVANKIQSHRQNSRPVLSSLPIQHNRTATPACQTVSPPLSWLSGEDKLQSWSWCFSKQQELNAGRSLPIPSLNLKFRFAAAVTAKTVNENYFH